MSFPLSDQPIFGEWLIFVEMQGHTYNKSFEVLKYGEQLYTKYPPESEWLSGDILFYIYCRQFSQMYTSRELFNQEMTIFVIYLPSGLLNSECR